LILLTADSLLKLSVGDMHSKLLDRIGFHNQSSLFYKFL